MLRTAITKHSGLGLLSDSTADLRTSQSRIASERKPVCIVRPKPSTLLAQKGRKRPTEGRTPPKGTQGVPPDVTDGLREKFYILVTLHLAGMISPKGDDRASESRLMLLANQVRGPAGPPMSFLSRLNPTFP